jgi:hypothetical protein
VSAAGHGPLPDPHSDDPPTVEEHKLVHGAIGVHLARLGPLGRRDTLRLVRAGYAAGRQSMWVEPPALARWGAVREPGEEWSVRLELGWWRVRDRVGDLVGQFAREGDALTFAEMAGPKARAAS